MGDDLLFENDRTRIRRIDGAEAGTSVICKEFLGAEADRRLQHESAVLRRISDLGGVPELLQTDSVRASLTLRDVNASALAPGPMEFDQLVEFAVSLAEILAGLHARGVVHKDINPANIMMVGPTSPTLIDYDLATTFPVERPRFTHHTDIVGTLNYLAPEQSGRTGWPVDQRADLYAFGATLYELATGGPVFAEDDPLRLVYAHLTQIPAPASTVRPELPPAFDEIVGRLLQKDPERRYQSAEGLLHDLRRLRDLWAAGTAAVFPLGESDFALELSAPTHAVGRASAVATLTDAFADALVGDCRAVLVSGPAGVGKTTVIDELRLPVTSAGGWFVTGKFDQYRQGAEADGMRHAFRGLGKMLLAEPEDELIAIRERLREELGANAGLVAAVIPEFATLLQVEPQGDVDDPLRAGQQLKQSGLQILRALGDPRRPLVIVVDDLQWAHAGPIELINAVVTDATLTGVLFVGAYRDGEVDAGHPLSAVLARWQTYPVPPPHVQLENLAPTDVAELVTEMLRAPVDEMTALVTALARHTGGNPFEAVEFLNALRRGQVLRPAASGWTFDPAGVADVIGQADVLTLLADRVAGLPASTRQFITTISCLGGDVALDVLLPADGTSAELGDVMPLLTPALEAGLLGLDTIEGVVRFRHDRVRQAVYDGLPVAQRGHRHLEIARRLAEIPGFRMIAAEQYQAALAEVVDPIEAGQVAELFHDAAAHARQLANYPLVERFLRTAIELTGPDHAALRWRLEGQYQTALVALGRFDDAAEVHQRIDRDCPDLMLRTGAARMQMVSLIMQNRSAEALELGCVTLNALDCPVPTGEQLEQQIANSCDELAEWAAQASAQERATGPGADAKTEAVSLILTTLIQAAFFSGSPLMPWLVVAAARIWSRSGPSIALLSPLGHAAFVTIALRDDFRTGHDVVAQVLAAANTINHEPDSSFVQFIYALTCGPWFAPLQDSLQAARAAHERLARAGDLYSAGCTYFVSVPLMLECADTIGGYQAEIGRGLEFAAATGNDQIEGFLSGHRALAAALSDDGQGDHAAEPRPGTAPNEPEPVTNGPAEAAVHLGRAVVAALLNDPVTLGRHAPPAVAMIPFYQATPPIILAHLTQALNLVIQAQRPNPTEKDDLLAQFGQHRDWIARRAADAPGNFAHLVVWLDAERAWADGQFDVAVRGFDAAQWESEARQRPWQRALIAERRGRFLLHHGLEHAARGALREAYRRYDQWGAARKIADLRAEFPFLTAVDDTVSPSQSRSSVSTLRQGSVSSQNIDLMAVLRASQAIGSETRLDRLADQVGQVLCELTGANSARLLLNDQDAGWLLLHTDGQMQPISSAITSGMLPATVIRYVERTREPLLVDDATRDDRFSQDPYLSGLGQCALLTLPVLSGGRPAAMLLLENRDTRGAFGANRLDTVMLLAGQLAVALGNAMLYTALECKVADRTRALEAANAQLELLAVTDPLTGLPNRRRLDDTMAREWPGQSTNSLPVSIAMIDIDHFKKYNDHYGHPAGDECLRMVATAISASVRESDVVIRYGGEEFAIFLADADEQTAARVTERVRAAVADLALPHEPTEAKRVTVSIGVATSMATTISPEELLSTADTFLYEAKRAGRNRVAAGAP